MLPKLNAKPAPKFSAKPPAKFNAKPIPKPAAKSPTSVLQPKYLAGGAVLLLTAVISYSVITREPAKPPPLIPQDATPEQIREIRENATDRKSVV